jgi:N6-L-threonylcarbamoyladenine synthase
MRLVLCYLTRHAILDLSSRPFPSSVAKCSSRRNLLTLAIETSCDDTAVSVLEKTSSKATIHFNSKITSDNRAYGGVYPIAAHESHQKTLATLVNAALRSLPPEPLATAHLGSAVWVKGTDGTVLRKKPDFVTATRGPGMRASLITGVDTAKGLAVAWQVPFLGVNHMQAHALTPRLVSALEYTSTSSTGDGNNVGESEHRDSFKFAGCPAFPYLSLLVSGGHTMLVLSKRLCDHEILSQTADIAIGDMLDKSARDILPREIIKSSGSVMYGRTLEHYAFADMSTSSNDYGYTSPMSNGLAIRKSSLQRDNPETQHDWSVSQPLLHPSPGVTPDQLAAKLSFSGIGSSVKSIITRNPGMDDAERRLLAREAMRTAFEHLGSRTLMALPKLLARGLQIDTLVTSGGVASNQYLKHILRVLLDSNGYKTMKLVFPPPMFCTDNAAMIAWAGIEMWEAGYRTELSAMAVKQWAIDPKANDGGILGIGGWTTTDGS